MVAVFLTAAILALSASASASAAVGATKIAEGTVTVDIGHPVNTYNPVRAMGAGVDSQSAGAPGKMLSAANLPKILASGWGSVSYRLYTELSVQHWHWNPAGSWSDAANVQGYWTGTHTPGAPIADSYGYRLPHRGLTRDQGNDDDYSRLDDGDSSTYWKSNPYLSARFTGESDGAHPQWALVDLGSTRQVNAIRIAWANPYAITYQVQYWNGDDAIYDPANGNWITFPSGAITGARGGTVTISLASSPLATRYVRILMTASSNTCDDHGAGDIRNCVGYAIGEVGVGRSDGSANFVDMVRHEPDNGQTVTYVSSVDPWHQPANQVTDQEQPGLDFIFTNGVTRGIPALVPVGMAYGTPDDAAAEVAYLEARGYLLLGAELGEEPDGQYMTPEDYGALYIQWASAVHAVAPQLQLGGPAFQGVNPASPGVSQDVPAWPDDFGNVSWLNRFLNFLAAHGQSAALSFMSFESYPLPCTNVAANLLDTPVLTKALLDGWRADGLPASVPMMATEYNMSFDTPDLMQQIAGALWHADFVASFLTNGGAAAYYYEYEPTQLSKARTCPSWGALGMFTTDANYQITSRTAQYYSARILTQVWSEPIDAMHQLYFASSDIADSHGRAIVTAYAVLRPDSQWSVMLINKDLNQAHTVQVVFSTAGSIERFTGKLTITRFGAAQYHWHPRGAHGFAYPNNPPVTTTLNAIRPMTSTLAPASITVVRGSIS